MSRGGSSPLRRTREPARSELAPPGIRESAYARHTGVAASGQPVSSGAMRPLLAAIVVCLVAASSAQAQTTVTFGSTLQQDANYLSANYVGPGTGGNECLARPYIGA